MGDKNQISNCGSAAVKMSSREDIVTLAGTNSPTLFEEETTSRELREWKETKRSKVC